jgi:nicotinate-nucleotide pyrophosphorylase (carboxylating)
MAAILSCERVALNFLQRMSGVATLTREFVDAVQDTNAVILDTRKTTPGMRALERYAVRAGGGRNHRFSLADGVLIKDNHIAAAAQDGTADLADVVRQARQSAPHTLRIEIECTDVEQAAQAVEGGADVILLDNMSPEDIRAALRVIDGRALVEASGGVTVDNVEAIARTGVDFISVGRLTHSAPALDISLEVSPV